MNGTFSPWITCRALRADGQVLHGEEVLLYYGGYKLGHKGERFTTRQIGLARMKRDRYAGYAASGPHAACCAHRCGPGRRVRSP